MRALLQDFRFAWRACQRDRATTGLAIILIGAAVGANAAIFSAVRAVIVRPFPYASADRLVVITDRNPSKRLEDQLLSPARYLEWQNSHQIFQDLAAYDTMEQNLTGLGRPDRVQVARLSSNMFSLTGTASSRGRAFNAADERPDAPAVAMVSHGLWQQRLGRTELEARTLRLDDRTFTIVGVMPPGFGLPKADVYLPLALGFRNSRVSRHLHAIGRLADGVDVGTARERVRQLSAELATAYPSTDAGWTTDVMPLRDTIVGDVRPTLQVLMGGVGLVLLIACATVANLLLVRALGRTRDVAVRLALGAPRVRILRQLLAESLVMTGAAGVAGLLLAAWFVQALKNLPFARFEEIRIDGTVVMMTTALTVLTGIAVAAAPAMTVWHRDLAGFVSAGGRDRTSDPLHHRAGMAIVVFQVAVAVALTTGAGLLVASLSHLMAVDPGFQAANVLTGRLSFPRPRYRGAADLRRFEHQLALRLESLPGVISVGVINTLPLTGRDTPFNFALEDRPAETHAQQLSAELRVASPGYFAAMGIPLISGRPLDNRDTAEAPPVLLVNRAMAQRFWRDGDPVGQRLSLDGPDGPWVTIVGVVGDVRHDALSTDPRAEMYLPFAQHTWPSLTLVVRARIRPQVLAASVRNAVATLDPELPLYDVRPLDEIVAGTLARPRLLGVLVGAFSAIALVLALTGVFGVMSHAVARRNVEMGVRMALGAEPRDVLSMIMREGLWLVGIGVTAGVAGAWLLSRVLSGFLFGVSPTDPQIFVLTSGWVLVAGLLACYIPARRAARVHPAAALRHL